MNFQIIGPDAFGRVDPPVMRFLQRLPQGRDVVVVPITRLDNFTFNPALGQLIGGRPWMLVDYSEFGWDWNQQSSYLWGRDRLDHEWFKTSEYRRFDDFIIQNQPVVTFQRELLAKDASDRMRPIEYLNFSAPVVADTEEQFNSRPISVFFQWGRSSESRPALHGDIFKESGRYGYEVCSQLDHIEQTIRHAGGRQVWCAIHTPHFARVPVEVTQQWFAKSKIVVSLGGCGKKTFRHGEINNSVIAMHRDGLSYSVNIRGWPLELGKEVESLYEGRKNPETLFQTYQMNHAASDALRPERYIPEVFVPTIQKML